jgi:membrane protease YdiL (CAAX protease family)
MSLKVGWQMLLWVFLFQIIAAIPVIIFMESMPNVFSESMLFTIAYLVGMISAFFFVKNWANKFQVKFTLNFVKFNFSIFLWVIIINFIFLILLEPLNYIIPMPDAFKNGFEKILFSPFWSFLMLVLLAPFFEELIFRGIILAGLLKNYTPLTGILHSALIFGVMHINPIQVVGASIWGIFIGWLYYRTKSLWICIFAHISNNLLVWLFTQIPILEKTQSIYKLVDNFIIYTIILTLSGLAIYTGIRMLYKLLPQTQNDNIMLQTQ